MTKEERDALIASARKTPWLDTMKRRETEALLEALDDAEKRVRDIEDLRARIVSAMSCEPDDDSDLVEAVRENVRERDDAERERDAARAQLAALRGALDRLLHATWVVLCECGTAGVPMLVRMATAADSARPVLADTEVAAREHDARARAPVEAERDQFAAALAEVMTPRGIYDAWSLNRVLLAAQREARVRADERAKALREAADVCRSGITEGTPAGWSHCAERLRAMVDEAERGTQ